MPCECQTTLWSSAIHAIRRRAPAALLALTFGVAYAGTARADGGEAAAFEPRSSPSVEWNDEWARFQPWEYVATGAAWTQALVIRFTAPVNRSRGTFSLDDHIVDALSVSGTAKDIVSKVAEIGYVGSMAYRLLDSTVVPGLVWGNGDVALQMTLIDLEAFGLAAVVLWNAQLLYGRERPMYRDCPDPARNACDNPDDNRYRSFIAGHTLIATTAAALTCVHHAHLPLYGGGAADAVACGGMIGVAAAVGLGRSMLETHYPTDTLLAWGIGVLAGYVVPSALHYGFGRASRRSATEQSAARSRAVRVTLIPDLRRSSAGATIAGTF